MTEPTHLSTSHADHGPGQLRAYMVVAIALAAFTAASFAINALEHAGTITPLVGFWLILGVAVVKAGLVALYFMHLISDWRLVYFVIVPALILAALTGFALLPDMVLDWSEG